MSLENVEAVRRAADAFNRGDVDAILEEADPEIEWRPLLQVLLGGKATVYRGHNGARDLYRDIDEAFTEQHVELLDIRDLGMRVLAIGRLRGRGKGSGAQTETAIAWLVEFKGDKVIRVREYLDPKEALEAAGVSE